MIYKYQKQVLQKPDKVSSFYAQCNAIKKDYQIRLLQQQIPGKRFFITPAQKFEDGMWINCFLQLSRHKKVVKLSYQIDSLENPLIQGRGREPLFTKNIILNNILDIVYIGERQISLNSNEGQEKVWQLKFEDKQTRFVWTIILIQLLYHDILRKHLSAGVNKIISEINGKENQGKPNFQNTKIEISDKQQGQSKNKFSDNQDLTKRLRDYSKTSNEQMIRFIDNPHIDLSNKLDLKIVEIIQLKKLKKKLQASQTNLNQQIKLQIFQLQGKLQSILMEIVSFYIKRQLKQQDNMLSQAFIQEAEKLRITLGQCEKVTLQVGLFKKKYEDILKEQKMNKGLIRENEQKILRLQGDVQDKTKDDNNKLLEQIQKNKVMFMKLTVVQQDMIQLKLTNNGQLNALRGQKQAIKQTLKNQELQCQQLKKRQKESETKLFQRQRGRLSLQFLKEQAQQQLQSSYKEINQSSTIQGDITEELKRQMKENNNIIYSSQNKIKILEDQLQEANTKIPFFSEKLQKLQKENNQIKTKFRYENQQIQKLLNNQSQNKMEVIKNSKSFQNQIKSKNILSIKEEQQNSQTEQNIKPMILDVNENQILNRFKKNKKKSQLEKQNIKLKKQLNSKTQELQKFFKKKEQYKRLIQAKYQQLNTETKQSNQLQKQNIELKFQLQVMEQKIVTIKEHLKENQNKFYTRLSLPKKKAFELEMKQSKLSKSLSKATLECEIMNGQKRILTKNKHLYEQEIQMQPSPSKKWFSERKIESSNLLRQKQKQKEESLPYLEVNEEFLQ